MSYAIEAFARSVAPQCPHMVSEIDEADGKDIAHDVPVTAMVLDWLGTVRYCNADAARLFGVSAHTVVGRHIKELIPDLPFSPSTPWYNVAYATFWAPQGPQRNFCGLNNGGGAFGLAVALNRLEQDGSHQIIVALAATGCSCLIAGTAYPAVRNNGDTCALVGRSASAPGSCRMAETITPARVTVG